MKFVIKSKDRLEKIEKMTLNLLRSYGVKDADIHIFVSDLKDYDDYKKKFPECNIIIGWKGIVGIDNFIVEHFEEGEKYIYMNDDVSEIYRLDDGKLKVLEKDEFNYLIDRMFLELRERDYSYSGLYPCKSSLYMAKQKEITTDLCLCMDPFSAVINNKDVILHNFVVKKEDGTEFQAESTDAEKTIQHFISKGGIVRFNHYCIKVEYHAKQGGYQGRTPMTEKLSAEALKEKYPNHITSVKYKKNGTTSIRLKKIKARDNNI